MATKDSNINTKSLNIIGSTEYVSVENYKNIPAKIDTGADSSSVWASDIRVTENGTLKFKLFAPESPYFDGRDIKRKDYKVSIIRSSNGIEQIRYRTNVQLVIGNHTIDAFMTLANRERNHFPILVGRKTISGKFLVDVSQAKVVRKKRRGMTRTKSLNQKLTKDPYKFHQEYIENQETGE